MKSRHAGSKVVAPDGGWGWVCVLGCAMAHFFLAGIARSFGIIYVVLRERYGSSAALTAWIGALYNVLRFCGGWSVMSLACCMAIKLGSAVKKVIGTAAIRGPIAAALVNRFRFRPVVISGGILMCIGFLVSAVAPNIICMFFSYGLMSGFGASLVFAPSYIIVGQYFDKKKGRAMGFSTVGSGFGGLCVPFILKGLFDRYGYFGAMLNMAAIVLNCCVIGAVYRSLEPTKSESSTSVENLHEMDVELAVIMENSPKANGRKSCQGDSDNEETGEDNMQSTGLLSDRDEKNTDQEETEATVTKSNGGKVDKENDEEKCVHLLTVDSATNHMPDSVDNQTKNEKDSQPQIHSKKIFDLALLANRTFVLYGLMIMSLSITQQTFNIFIVAICKERGISASSGVLLAAISGVADMIGRFISGFIFDLQRVRSFRRFLLPAVLIIGGLCLTVLPFFTSYLGIAFMSAGMGCFVAMAHAQRATVLTDFIDKSRTANAVGFTIWFQGIGQLFGPAFAGFLKDMFGYYDPTFYFGGLILIFTSMLYLSESYVTWRCTRTKTKSQPSDRSQVET